MIDLHVHLYGCLEAQDVLELGKQTWERQKNSLTWYAEEFAKHLNRTPSWEEYWTSHRGLDLLREDYEVHAPLSFEAFQAKFNLLIALFPIPLLGHEIFHLVFQKLSQQGLRGAELRVSVPERLSSDESQSWLWQITESVAEWEEKNSSFRPQIVVSVPRSLSSLQKTYEVLRQFQKDHKERSSSIIGIDFSSYEENSPPSIYKNFFEQFHEDNRRSSASYLDSFYHVGESFQTLSLMSSVRWVSEAHNMGVTRLGHAISLGVDPFHSLHREWEESQEEREAHLEWLARHQKILKEHGYVPDPIFLSSSSSGIYTESLCSDIQQLQNAVMKQLSREGATIEVCPTSNLRLMGHPTTHYRRFLSNKLSLVVGSDDPGIFVTDLKKEHELFRATSL